MPRSSKSQPAAQTGPRLVKAAPRKTSQPDVTHEQIAMRAYELYVQEGFMHGNDVDHWVRAERELKGPATMPRTRRVTGTRARA